MRWGSFGAEPPPKAVTRTIYRCRLWECSSLGSDREPSARLDPYNPGLSMTFPALSGEMADWIAASTSAKS